MKHPVEYIQITKYEDEPTTVAVVRRSNPNSSSLTRHYKRCHYTALTPPTLNRLSLIAKWYKAYVDISNRSIEIFIRLH